MQRTLRTVAAWPAARKVEMGDRRLLVALHWEYKASIMNLSFSTFLFKPR